MKLGKLDKKSSGGLALIRNLSLKTFHGFTEDVPVELKENGRKQVLQEPCTKIMMAPINQKFER